MENQVEEDQSLWSKFTNGLIELIEFIAIVGAILVIIRFFVAEPHKVSGHSMVPNFQDGDYIITNKLTVRMDNPQRGEVIILQHPQKPSEVLIKRIIGLPNEHIKVSGGGVYINGQKLDEPYLPQGVKTQGELFLAEGEEITIPDDQYFVMGDNRPGSSDSREWGTVKKEQIIGQAWFRYWPPQEFGLIAIDHSSY